MRNAECGMRNPKTAFVLVLVLVLDADARASHLCGAHTTGRRGEDTAPYPECGMRNAECGIQRLRSSSSSSSSSTPTRELHTSAARTRPGGAVGTPRPTLNAECGMRNAE